jgi:23S rRNA pseudouridine1911/1915/1917 synthase
VVLFENADVVALDKPPGVSMATSSKAEKSEAAVLARLLAACGARADERLLLVHRLDVGTSGVVLLAKNGSAHRALTLALQNRRAKKTYRALVWGHPRPSDGVLEDLLGRDPKDGRKMKVRASGVRAITRYRTLSRLPSVADLVVSPETGRTHQIRVQLASRGHPVVGDDLYGGATRWRGVRTPSHRGRLAAVVRPLLHAERIEIPEMGIDVRARLSEDYEMVLTELAFPLPRDHNGDKLRAPKFRR